MSGFTVLGRDWKRQLGTLIRSATRELLISSPYVTRDGTDFVAANLSSSVRKSGRLEILTDLSPLNVCQGATDPSALQSLSCLHPRASIYHLPRLHAKVYVADKNCAIITSGNLTSGGLTLNYEYGVQIMVRSIVSAVHRDIVDYSQLAVTITSERLARYCQVADEAREAFRRKQASSAKAMQRRFDLALRDAEDELVRFRLAGGAMHTVFERTIVYLLRLHGSLRTQDLHAFVEGIHPDLCDNAVDRIIDGKRFGKKWKHAVRTAQQQLKKKGVIELRAGRWRIIGPATAAGATK